MPEKPADPTAEPPGPSSGAVLIGLQLNPAALDTLIALGWLPNADRVNPDAITDSVVALLKYTGDIGLKPPITADRPAQPAEAASAPNPVRFELQAYPSMQDDLVGCGFLADSDRGNTDAVADATVLLLKNGADLRKNLADLFTSLHKAKLRFDAGDDAGRGGALYALDAILRFLMLFEAVHVGSLLTPLALLFGDMVSLDGGQVCPMVAPAKKRGGTRASGFYNALRGITVFVARRLEASGMAHADARKAVAKELANTGVRPARKGSRVQRAHDRIMARGHRGGHRVQDDGGARVPVVRGEPRAPRCCILRASQSARGIDG